MTTRAFQNTSHYGLGIPDGHGTPKTIDLESIDKTVVREIITQIYTTNASSWVQSPEHIPAFLSADFFGLGVRPSNVSLSALTVRIVLETADPAAFGGQFERLLSTEQVWTGNFKLDIWLWMDSFGLGFIYNMMADALRALRSMVKQTENRGGVVWVRCNGRYFAEEWKEVYKDFVSDKEEVLKRKMKEHILSGCG
ncbi:hypothetical protein BU26DRAFT_320341 [Trematosphaeria pertusa]|uniref:Uncharacterized protein n=1 Tax=Trematosphaeria pertusa TaxID=390896 RepID=A0A6A6IHE0_9PLEO|nr:uncharacterized protein BU26DRAFT_320341 [Trematosphaeria pertusa]KAF2249587.1 hypothetical protein BU26DRAFT_320341 [Trematosphaeria pertusa]